MYFQHFSPLYSPYAPGFAGVFVPILVAALVWTLVLKGFALWYSARGKQKWWFIALLIINTLGILEIIYLIWFRPKDDHTTPAHSSSQV